MGLSNVMSMSRVRGMRKKRPQVAAPPSPLELSKLIRAYFRVISGHSGLISTTCPFREKGQQSTTLFELSV